MRLSVVALSWFPFCDDSAGQIIFALCFRCLLSSVGVVVVVVVVVMLLVRSHLCSLYHHLLLLLLLLLSFPYLSFSHTGNHK